MEAPPLCRLELTWRTRCLPRETFRGPTGGEIWPRTRPTNSCFRPIACAWVCSPWGVDRGERPATLNPNTPATYNLIVSNRHRRMPLASWFAMRSPELEFRLEPARRAARTRHAVRLASGGPSAREPAGDRPQGQAHQNGAVRSCGDGHDALGAKSRTTVSSAEAEGRADRNLSQGAQGAVRGIRDLRVQHGRRTGPGRRGPRQAEPGMRADAGDSSDQNSLNWRWRPAAGQHVAAPNPWSLKPCSGATNGARSTSPVPTSRQEPRRRGARRLSRSPNPSWR